MPTVDEIRDEKPAEYYRLLEECLAVARHHGTIYYEDAGELIDVIPLNMNRWAAAINAEVVEHGHPMLGAVIVGQGDDTPGEGFYTFAHEIGRLERDPEQMTDEEKHEFWREELERVYETFEY